MNMPREQTVSHTTLYRATQYALLLSIALIPFRLHLPEPYSNALSNVFLMSAAITALLFIIQTRSIPNIHLIRKTAPWIAIIFIVITLGEVVVRQHGIFLPFSDVAQEYVRLCLNTITFLLIILFGSKENKSFITVLSASLLTPLLLFPLFYKHNTSHVLPLFLGDLSRFQGLLNDPNFFATLILVPILFLLTYALYARNKYYYILATFGLLIITTMLL